MWGLIREAASDANTTVMTKYGIASSGFAGTMAVLESHDWLAVIAAVTALVTLLAGLFKVAESAVRIWVDLRRHARDEQQAKLDARRREMLELAKVRKPKG